MFYENDLKLKKMKYSSINYANFSNGLNSDTDEGLLPIKFSPNTYNFNYSFGALTTGLGVGEAEFVFDIEDKSKKKKFIMPDDVDILGCWIYNYFNYYINQYYDILVVYASDKKMYYGFLYESIKTMFRMGSFTFDECPILINYNYNNQDVVLVCDKTKMYLWNYNTGTVTIANPPKIASMSMHYDKIFATMADDKKSIYYSQDFNPKAWNVALTQGSVINLLDDKGTLNKVVSFDDNLFVFREFGIAKLSIYSNMDKFNVVQVFTSGNRIFENTVTVCGDKIIFLASDGLYSFNGNTTSKLDINIDNILLKNNNDTAVASFYNGCYYLACKVEFSDDKKIMCENDDFVNNALLECDLNSGTMNILRGVDILNMQNIKGTYENKLLVCVKRDGRFVLGQVEKSGMVFDVSTPKMWQSPKSDFGLPNKQKLIKTISLLTATDITIEIDADGVKHNQFAAGSTLPVSISPNVKGNYFSINFICDSATCNISNPTVIFGY